ncbi:Serine/threonine-protein phosphatase PP1 [Tritrichomonas foetus]|uniref:Serine/threonine-protein phosphatase n=1 Tax=Tritrichomonas foetus TaxID=1144522 RepID=A0A1J4J8U3_9EUKA|nr:Serine/threonine-protein phosphatase PP1 [Tritrichomonas foetus]|eukprot:OHS94107.1 Serine/threonine-protein phosphatase PP1 [Tritrichomonas foetus]
MENYLEDDQVAIEDTLELILNTKTLDDGDYIQLNNGYLFSILKLAQKVLLDDDILLKIEPPTIVVGDLHAQYNSFRKVLDIGGNPENSKYVFLGDYIDRGSNSTEVMITLLCYKLMYPKNVYLIRGNHETKETCMEYGFYNECTTRYSQTIFDEFIKCFDNLPMAAIIGNSIFCVHGGISQDLYNVNDLMKVERPLKIPERGFLLDLLWSDPSVIFGDFHRSQRGGSFTYGAEATDCFLEYNNLKMICRSHQMVMEGYEYAYGKNNQKCISIFTCPKYCNEFDNKGAIMHVDKNNDITFTVIE